MLGKTATPGTDRIRPSATAHICYAKQPAILYSDFCLHRVSGVPVVASWLL